MIISKNHRVGIILNFLSIMNFGLFCWLRILLEVSLCIVKFVLPFSYKVEVGFDPSLWNTLEIVKSHFSLILVQILEK